MIDDAAPSTIARWQKFAATTAAAVAVLAGAIAPSASAEPTSTPRAPVTAPREPVAVAGEPAEGPGSPLTASAEPVGEPNASTRVPRRSANGSAGVPREPAGMPRSSAGEPGTSAGVPRDPVAVRDEPVAGPGEPGTGPGESGTGPGAPGAGPSAPVAGAPVEWVWRLPLDGNAQVVRPFDPPAGPYAPGHRGVDLAAPPGAVIRASGAGTVRFAGPVGGRGVVSVTHPDGRRTTYEPVQASVRAGDRVAPGTVLGHLDGRHPGCPTTCLHWGLIVDEQYVDPLVLLNPGRVRLYPVTT